MEHTPDTTKCVKCGVEIYKQDHLETVDGYVCEECLNDNYKSDVQEGQDEILDMP